MSTVFPATHEKRPVPVEIGLKRAWMRPSPSMFLSSQPWIIERRFSARL
jgi:hypothetical protein